MTSLIPSITTGLKRKRNTRNVSCMVHGTSEIGYVLPTYCRQYINNAKIKIATRTGVRFSPMFVPTMGKLDVRHYHSFVPFNRCYAAFDAFLAQEPYMFSSGSRIPSKVPSFRLSDVFISLFSKENSSVTYDGDVFDSVNDVLDTSIRKYLTCSIYKKASSAPLIPSASEIIPASVGEDTDEDLLGTLFCSHYINNLSNDVVMLPPGFIVNRNSDGGVSDIYFTLNSAGSEVNGNLKLKSIVNLADPSTNRATTEFVNQLSFPSYDYCDWLYQVNYNGTTYYVCFNYNGPIKRLRSIFLGLGYSFNPYDADDESILKLLAFYRAYYSKFGITRQHNFNDSWCAFITRHINNTYTELMRPDQPWTQSNVVYGFQQFLLELLDLPYTCPPDYFSSSMQDLYGFNRSQIGVNDGTGSFASVDGNTGANASDNNAIALKLANIFLKRVNVNNIVGRSIANILRSRYGDIQVDDESTEGVIRVGADNVPIEIGAIFNQSASGDAVLGEFSGVATGGKKAKPFEFVTPSFGVFITLTAVVPEMGYFQGKLRENSAGTGDVYEFYNQDFDAVGYQSVRYSELVADRCFMMSGLPSGTNLGNYGVQPRYTDQKVGFNRVLGDVSLPHMVDSLLPYTLDRYFNPRDKNLPLNNPNYSRRGDIGNTNRIFQVTAPTDDHVIYQIFFDISVADTMKPLSHSYDTLLSSDNASTEVSHE